MLDIKQEQDTSLAAGQMDVQPAARAADTATDMAIEMAKSTAEANAEMARAEPIQHYFDTQRLYALVNEYRVANNLKPLAHGHWPARALAMAARDSSAKMAASDFADVVGHGADLMERLLKYGGPGWWIAAGENICCQHVGPPDPSSTDTPEKVMDLWKGSPSHNALMLNPAFTHAGASLAVSKVSGQHYWTLIMAQAAS